MAEFLTYPPTPSRRNPWEDDTELFGTIGDVLTLAYRTGHLKRPSDEGDRDEARVEQLQQKYPSMKLIQLLKSMTELQKQIHQTNVDIQCRMQDQETSDLTHVSVIEQRVKQVGDLNEHLQKVVQEKDSLISRLQQPFIGDFMKIEATYHKHVKELLVELSPILSDLSSHLDRIMWAANVDLKSNHMDALLDDIESGLAGLQTSVTSLTQMRNTMSRLHNSIHV